MNPPTEDELRALIAAAEAECDRIQKLIVKVDAKERSSMQIPAVMFIEMAMDELKMRDSGFIEREIKAFDTLGPGRKSEILTSIPGGDPMTAGYLLGIETARALLSTMPLAIKAGVEI